MDKMIHTNLKAMQGIMTRQTAIANNMANADTTGFRAEIVNARALYIQGAGLDSRASTSEAVTGADMNGGTVENTGGVLDIALNGDALLGVQAPDGAEAYTRRGDLVVNETGLLTTGDGHPVLGQNGPITLPSADKITIASNGAISIVPVGGDPAQPIEAGRLKLVSPQGSEIKKGRDNLFRVPGDGVLPEDPDASVTTGALEGSNVNMTQSLVDMIEASRAWETQVKMLTTAQELDDSGASIMRMPN
ncbi:MULTISPECIES: flagellar basal body rod protein FlgF [Blastomonas]|uniref:flagellar basal body rod protein FlgF n=1 Tax=Blastomonas TaxID=150203 RepID=UPI0025A3D05A|nr:MULTISPECIES: flagellar basal body rod protein FlgF [Blastomonas]MDM7957726.1 flagellar basal body rod protein FlgF [Blastomonas sp.]MDM7967536.1 flagellar basal body rod protein FlgF [Blastomonas fulva]